MSKKFYEWLNKSKASPDSAQQLQKLRAELDICRQKVSDATSELKRLRVASVKAEADYAVALDIDSPPPDSLDREGEYFDFYVYLDETQKIILNRKLQDINANTFHEEPDKNSVARMFFLTELARHIG